MTSPCHIGVPKQWNGGHVVVPNKSCGSWNLFLCKPFLLFQWITEMLATRVKMLYCQLYNYYLPQVLLLINFGKFVVQLTWCTMYHNNNKQLFWALSSLKCTTCTLELQNNDWSGIMVNPDLMSTIFLGSIVTGMSISSNLACQIIFFSPHALSFVFCWLK